MKFKFGDNVKDPDGKIGRVTQVVNNQVYYRIDDEIVSLWLFDHMLELIEEEPELKTGDRVELCDYEFKHVVGCEGIIEQIACIEGVNYARVFNQWVNTSKLKIVKPKAPSKEEALEEIEEVKRLNRSNLVAESEILRKLETIKAYIESK